MNLFLFLFKTYNNYFFWLTLPASVVLQRGGLCPLLGQRDALPPTPPMMFDFLCCAHEAVPPTLSPSPIIYICSSF